MHDEALTTAAETGSTLKRAPLGRRRFGVVAGIAGLVALSAACAPTPQAVEPPNVPAAAPSSDPTPTPTPTLERNESARGNLIKTVGEPFGSWEDPDAPTMKFVVTGIEVGVTCTGEFAEPAENGHFVRLNLEGETGPDLPSDLDIGAGSWTVIADNGTTFNGYTGTYAASACLPDAEYLPGRIGPGERVAGSVVLDVPTAAGTIIYRDYLFEGGWEWSYPQ